MIDKPEIRIKNGRTLMTVTVQLEDGLGLRESGKVATYCQGVGPSYLIFGEREIPTNSILFLRGSGIGHGDKVDIAVIGTGKKAEDYASALYDALSCEDRNDMFT